MAIVRRVIRETLGPRDESGTAAIEFALVAPFLLILMVGVVELGVAMYESMQVSAAVEAGILYAAANGFDSASISAAVTAAAPMPPAFRAVTATPAPTEFCGCPDGSGSVANLGTAPPCSTTACAGETAAGAYVQVSASLDRLVLLPARWGLPSTFTATAVIRIH